MAETAKEKRERLAREKQDKPNLAPTSANEVKKLVEAFNAETDETKRAALLEALPTSGGIGDWLLPETVEAETPLEAFLNGVRVNAAISQKGGIYLKAALKVSDGVMLEEHPIYMAVSKAQTVAFEAGETLKGIAIASTIDETRCQVRFDS